MGHMNSVQLKSHLNGKQERTAKLVGRRCLVQGSVGGVDTTVLWDTGSQVSIVGAGWKRKHLPDVEVRPVEELLEQGVLDLVAAHGTEIPYEGWIGVNFNFSPKETLGMIDKPVLVHILVTSSSLERPIIGFNVIEELALRKDADQIPTSLMVQNRLGSALDEGHKTARAVLSVLKKQNHENSPYTARLGRRAVTIPKNKVIEMECGHPRK